MTTTRPATVSSELLDRLRRFLLDAEPTEFEVRKLERDAEALSNASAVEASVARAGIAALRWDLTGVERWAKNALALDPRGHATLHNVALSFRMINRPDLGKASAEHAVIHAPLDFDVVDHAIGFFCSDGDLDRAVELERDYYQRAGTHRAVTVSAGQFASVLRDAGIPQARLRFELRAALDVLTEAKRRYKRIGFSIDREPDGQESVVVGVGFRGSFDEEMEFEAALAAKLASDGDWQPSRLAVELQAQ